LVGDILEELIREISVRVVKLDPVESGSIDGLDSRIGVPLDAGRSDESKNADAMRNR